MYKCSTSPTGSRNHLASFRFQNTFRLNVWNRNGDRWFSDPVGEVLYSGKLPDGVKGEFGPGLRIHIPTLYHVANVSEPKIHEFLENMGVLISKATISRILTEDNDLFHEEKSDIFLSGLNSTTYQQIDDTSARVNGNNWYTQIICNPYYAAYFTVPHKNVEMKKRTALMKRHLNWWKRSIFLRSGWKNSLLSVSVYDYIFDRVSNKFEMLSLAQLIREKSALKDEGVST